MEQKALPQSTVQQPALIQPEAFVKSRIDTVAGLSLWAAHQGSLIPAAARRLDLLVDAYTACCAEEIMRLKNT